MTNLHVGSVQYFNEGQLRINTLFKLLQQKLEDDEVILQYKTHQLCIHMCSTAVYKTTFAVRHFCYVCIAISSIRLCCSLAWCLLTSLNMHEDRYIGYMRLHRTHRSTSILHHCIQLANTSVLKFSFFKIKTRLFLDGCFSFIYSHIYIKLYAAPTSQTTPCPCRTKHLFL